MQFSFVLSKSKCLFRTSDFSSPYGYLLKVLWWFCFIKFIYGSKPLNLTPVNIIPDRQFFFNDQRCKFFVHFKFAFTTIFKIMISECETNYVTAMQIKIQLYQCILFFFSLKEFYDILKTAINQYFRTVIGPSIHAIWYRKS